MGVASSAFEGFNIDFGGEHTDKSIAIAVTKVNPNVGSKIIAIQYHVIGW